MIRDDILAARYAAAVAMGKILQRRDVAESYYAQAGCVVRLAGASGERPWTAYAIGVAGGLDQADFASWEAGRAWLRERRRARRTFDGLPADEDDDADD